MQVRHYNWIISKSHIVLQIHSRMIYFKDINWFTVNPYCAHLALLQIYMNKEEIASNPFLSNETDLSDSFAKICQLLSSDMTN